MRDMTDPGNIDRVDVGETNPRTRENKSGVGGYFANQLALWSVVILVAVVFVVAILVVAL
jgi:hypothetical protein